MPEQPITAARLQEEGITAVLLDGAELTAAEAAQLEDEAFRQRAIAYFLAELTEAEAEQLEEESFADAHRLAQLKLIEEDLIDAYLRQELDAPRRQRFEQNYLTTEARLDQVLTAAALYRHLNQPPPVPSPTWAERFRAFWYSQSLALRTASTLAAVVLVVGSALWLIRQRPSGPQTIATLTLSISDSNRAQGPQVQKIKLPLGADALRVNLVLPAGANAAGGYRVTWESVSGEAQALSLAGQDAQAVWVLIPAAKITPGQYTLKLFAVQPDGAEQRIPGNYFFTAE